MASLFEKEVEILDLNDHQMPLFSVDIGKNKGNILSTKLLDKIARQTF
jgi:hypothetical protein